MTEKELEVIEDRRHDAVMDLDEAMRGKGLRPITLSSQSAFATRYLADHDVDALIAEVRRLNEECEQEADARGALERRLMRLGETP